MSGLLLGGDDADSDSRPRSANAATKAWRMMKREQEIIIVEMIIYLVQWHWLLLVDVRFYPTFKLKEVKKDNQQKGTFCLLFFLRAAAFCRNPHHSPSPFENEKGLIEK